MEAAIDLVSIGPHVLEAGNPLSNDEQHNIEFDAGVRRTSVIGLVVEVVVQEQGNDEDQIAGHVTDELRHWSRPGLAELRSRCDEADQSKHWQEADSNYDAKDPFASSHRLETLPVFQPLRHHHLHPHVYTCIYMYIHW